MFWGVAILACVSVLEVVKFVAERPLSQFSTITATRNGVPVFTCEAVLGDKFLCSAVTSAHPN
jgi:hypothetical protein